VPTISSMIRARITAVSIGKGAAANGKIGITARRGFAEGRTLLSGFMFCILHVPKVFRGSVH
jgi:hypothetical protein